MDLEKVYCGHDGKKYNVIQMVINGGATIIFAAIVALNFVAGNKIGSGIN